MGFIEGESEFTAIAGWIYCCGGQGGCIWVGQPLWRDAIGKSGIILKFRDHLDSL